MGLNIQWKGDGGFKFFREWGSYNLPFGIYSPLLLTLEELVDDPWEIAQACFGNGRRRHLLCCLRERCKCFLWKAMLQRCQQLLPPWLVKA
jgi:hypothetical protein